VRAIGAKPIDEAVVHLEAAHTKIAQLAFMAFNVGSKDAGRRSRSTLPRRARFEDDNPRAGSG
jgi:hypothetical protein